MPRSPLAPFLRLCLLFLIAGCAPVVQGTGTQTTTTLFGDDHIRFSDGREVFKRSWGADSQPKGIVVALHGFNDHSRAWVGTGEALSRAGYLVIAYDQRGFGHDPDRGIWAGHDRMVADVRETLDEVRDLYPDTPLFLAGESMGGAVSIAALTTPPAVSVDGVILIAPAVWGRATMHPVQVWALDFFAHTLPSMKLEPEGLNITPSDNTEMLRELGRDPYFIRKTRVDAIFGLVNLMDIAYSQAAMVNVPTLLLYGERDEIVPKEPTCKVIRDMLRANPEGTDVRIYDNGFHMLTRDLDADTVIRDMVAWLDHIDQAPDRVRVRETAEEFCSGNPGRT